MPSNSAMPKIPEETLARMPPAQRAQLEAMLKSRGGARPANQHEQGLHDAESLSRAGAFVQNNKSCTTKVVSASPDRQEIHVDCVRGKPGLPGTWSWSAWTRDTSRAQWT